MADVEIDYGVLSTVIDAFTSAEQVFSAAANMGVPVVDSDDEVATGAAPVTAAAATALLQGAVTSSMHGRTGAQAAYDGFKQADAAS